MLLDGLFNFSSQQSLTGTSDVVSTNVYDAGSAVKLWQGGGRAPKVLIQQTASGGTTPTLRARFVGADDAGLTSNVITLADTGVSAAIVAADLPRLIELVPNYQTTAKRYYGLIYLQGGTTPTATVNAQVGEANQTNNVRS